MPSSRWWESAALEPPAGCSSSWPARATGWSQGPRGRHFFIRQLRDIKISVRVESFGPAEMDLYATWCGRALALSHARSGSSATLSGYMGKSDVFDEAVAAFGVAYADQNEKDHAALDRAVRMG